MEKSKVAVKEVFVRGWGLFRSAFLGAFDGVKAAANRPKATNWKEFVVNDIRLYFAPLTGATGGVVKALRGSHKHGH